MQNNKNTKILILSIMILFSLAGCGVFEDPEPVEPAPVVQIANLVVSATGELVPATSANLSVAMPGIVDEVFGIEGQSVTAGEQLLVLSSLAQANAGLAAAELELIAAQQALDELNETAKLANATAWLALLDAQARYNLAEEAWDNLDQDDYQDDIDDAQEDVLEAEEDLEEAEDTFDRYSDLDEDNSLRKRYEDDLQDAQEDYNEKVRAHADLIIELERTEASWQAALAAMEQAQADFDATISGPDQELLNLAAARLAAAEAQVEAARVQVDHLTLVAPFDGTIVKVNINPGEYAAPGQPVVVMADLENLYIETTDLNEIDVVQIEAGDLVVVTFDAIPGEEFSGTVTEISSKSSEGLGVNYTVIIELDGLPENARWGMTAFVDIEVGN